MKSATLIFLFFLFIIACNDTSTTNKTIEPSKAQSEKPNTKNFISPKANVTVEEAFELIKKSALLIDVRNPSELNEIAYDVKSIKNIPLDELQNRISEVPKNVQVIVACRSGGRSSAAYSLLEKNGFENIANMLGGMNAWSEKSLPIIKGSK